MKTFTDTPTFTVNVDSPAQRLVLRDGIAERGQVPVLLASTGADPTSVVGFVDRPRLSSTRGVAARFVLLETHPKAKEVRLSLRNGQRRALQFQAQIARDGRVDLIRAVPVVELSVGAAAGAGAAAAGRRIAKEGLRWPSPLPAPFNTWRVTGKRFLRTNRGTLLRAGADGLVVTGAVYAGSRWAAKAREEDDKRRERRLRRLAARLTDSIMLSRPTLHRITDAAGNEIERPEIPGEAAVRTTGRVLDRYPWLRRALFRGTAIGIGAAGGASLGHVLHGRSRKTFVKTAAAAGGLVGATMFSMDTEHDLKPVADSIRDQIDRAAAPVRAGRTETQSLSTLPERLGASLDLVQHLLVTGELRPLRPLYDGRWDGPLIFSSDHLNELKKKLLVEDVAGTLEGVDGDDDHLRALAGQRVNAFARRTHTTVELERPRDDAGRYQEERSTLGRLAKVGLGAAALAGGAAYLRGRMAGATGGVGATLRAGGGQLLSDSQKAAGLVRTAAGGALDRLRQRGVRV